MHQWFTHQLVLSGGPSYGYWVQSANPREPQKRAMCNSHCDHKQSMSDNIQRLGAAIFPTPTFLINKSWDAAVPSRRIGTLNDFCSVTEYHFKAGIP